MRWNSAWAGGLAAAAVVGVAGIGAVAARAPGVAPWDVPDAPNPYPGAPMGAPKVADPKRLVRMQGLQGATDNGYLVKIVTVGRRGRNSMDEELPDTRPLWSPDGSPFRGHARTGTVDNPGDVLEDKGARFLTFEFTGPKTGRVDVMGYVPDGAREATPRPEFHGWDRAQETDVNPTMRIYRTCVVVDDRSASHYRFAVADGEWTPVASVPFPPYKRENATLLRGEWGTLRRVVIPRPRSTSRWTMDDEHGTYVASEATLAPSNELRVRFVDALGKETWPYGWPKGVGPARIIVESRPWHWVELSGVHYDPDPAKWEKGYWGDEGNGSLSRVGGTSLQAIIRPVPNEYHGWNPDDVYAPDGRLWRGHPLPRAVFPAFSGDVDYTRRLVAGFQLEADRVGRDRPARIEAFAAKGATPGEGLEKSLARTAWATNREDQMMFPRPATPYVQFAVRYAGDTWRKVGEVSIPHVIFPEVAAEERPGYNEASHLYTMFSVSVRSNGEASTFWLSRGERPGFPGHGGQTGIVAWPADDEARIVARLKSGRRIPLQNTSVGTSGDGTSSRSVDFNQTLDGDPLYDVSRLGDPAKTRLKLSEIAAFEIETRVYSAPVYLVAKLPPAVD